jgi:hypothetical protein
LSRNGGSASVGREPLGEETAIGEAKEDAPVEVQGLMSPKRIDLICRTAVYVTRMYGGVGGVRS